MIKVAIVGTGGMAGSHAEWFQNRIKGCRVVACCDVVPERAKAFAARFGIPACYTDMDEMLRGEQLDAVSNVTPDRFHAPLTLKAIARGLHVLCEKPLATCYADARKMAVAAGKKGVMNMVHFSYRNSPAIHRAAQLVRDGKIGRVIHFDSSYLQSWLASKAWGDWRVDDNLGWRLSTGHGSMGVLGDLGVHIVDFATYAAGDVRNVHCRLKTFDKAPGGRIGKYVLDANDSAVITVELSNGALGVIHTSRWATGHANSLRLEVHGDKGALQLNLDESSGQIKLCLGRDVDSNKWKTVTVPGTPNIYQRFIKSIRTGRNDQPDFARGAAIQKILDACVVSDAEDRIVPV
ncbi:MAG: Gfo/Idh/MocA family oxidoreductase [Lentisphaerae bacterium]|nr:Gfo/Idh/MocA family oxidoreductase [Lentisphaerota bacterium]